MAPTTRKRFTCITLSILAGACGLLSRSRLIPLPRFITTYAGDTLRHTAFFGLILGYGFKLSDLAGYCTGIPLGSTLDHLLRTTSK